MKTKHEALLSRLPAQAGSSPKLTSPGTSLTSIQSPVHSPHHSSASLPRTPIDSPRPVSPIPLPRHTRRVSVTPDEVALLADQNAELLNKLEKLEEESDKADQAGKRKLRKLEKEIQALRDELDNTQAHKTELEERVRTSIVLDEDEIQRRKELREERVRSLRESSVHSSESIDDEVKDFAPPSGLPKSRKSMIISEVVPSFPLPSPPLRESDLPNVAESVPSTSSTPSTSSFPHTTQAPSQPQLEYAIISQLLSKIRELEDTNTQIKTEQTATSERLRAAQRDSETLRRVYESITEEAGELGFMIDVTPSLQPSLTPTVNDAGRFRSLRKSRAMDDGDSDEEFASGIPIDKHSTQHKSFRPNKPTTNQKPRKSVVGLFDDADTSVFGPPAPDYPPSLQVSSSFRTPSPLPTELEDMSFWSTAATEGVSLTSPTVPTHILSPTLASGSFRRKHTLGSELGSEFGDDWGENAGNHHLRASSLYDLASMMKSGEVSSPGVSPIASPPVMPSFRLPSNAPSESGWEDVEDRSILANVTPTRSKGKGLQLVIEPPTPQTNIPTDSHSPSFPGGLKSPRLSRNYRLSQTVRARTNRWVEGRYTEPSGPVVRRRRPTRPPISHASRPSDASAIFSETFDTVVRQLSFSGVAPDDDDHLSEIEDIGATEQEGNALSGDTSVVVAGTPKTDGFVGFILEVWLWLQFAIVVLVFLWAMARRGPKSILHEAESRRRQGTITKR